MDKVATLSDRHRRELFEDTALEMGGINPAIVEKDFWVCWTLQKLFACEDLKNKLIFKGGTSLSKVYNLIYRFSEDIDLILDWEILGYGPGQQDPWEEQPSNSKQNRFNAAFNERTAVYMSDYMMPVLRRIFTTVPKMAPAIREDEPHIVRIEYPHAFVLQALRPEIRLEIGPPALKEPAEWADISPYAADIHGDIFENSRCRVNAITAERTFWEKATILHQQAHRSNTMPKHYSRHYYDLFQMINSPVKKRALSDLNLLADVAAFKHRFYRCPWAKYEDAAPGTFKLVPSEEHQRQLFSDYRSMQVMFFRTPPGWDEIVAGLAELEQEINGLKTA